MPRSGGGGGGRKSSSRGSSLGAVSRSKSIDLDNPPIEIRNAAAARGLSVREYSHLYLEPESSDDCTIFTKLFKEAAAMRSLSVREFSHLYLEPLKSDYCIILRPLFNECAWKWGKEHKSCVPHSEQIARENCDEIEDLLQPKVKEEAAVYTGRRDSIHSSILHSILSNCPADPPQLNAKEEASVLDYEIYESRNSSSVLPRLFWEG